MTGHLVRRGEHRRPVLPRLTTAAFHGDGAYPSRTTFHVRTYRGGVWHVGAGYDIRRDVELTACGRSVPHNIAEARPFVDDPVTATVPGERLCKRCVR